MPKVAVVRGAFGVQSRFRFAEVVPFGICKAGIVAIYHDVFPVAFPSAVVHHVEVVATVERRTAYRRDAVGNDYACETAANCHIFRVTNCYNTVKGYFMTLVGLRQVRSKKQFRRQKVALDFGISREALSYYENGKRSPGVETFGFFGITSTFR